MSTRVVVIGGTGHIGTFLVPRLVEAGYSVINVSRSLRKPYRPHAAWERVEQFSLDRDTEETSGTFGARLLEAKPDAVIDLTCYRIESASPLVDSLRGQIAHFLHCGTIWVHGPGIEVPITEEQTRRPISDYGVRKAEIEAYLLGEARENGFPATVLHPGHLVGPGWIPLNPAANFNPRIFADLATGVEVLLPNLGRETLHHVHADDVGQAFVQALANRSAAIGESFHVVSPAALTLVGYAESVAGWFGQQARIRFLLWEEWRRNVIAKEAQVTWDHIARSPNCSIEKARRALKYEPRYSSLAAIRESVEDLIARRRDRDSIGKIDVFVEFVIVQIRPRRKEAGDLHLFIAGIVEHVHGPLREEHRAAFTDRRHFARYQHAPRSAHHVDHLFAVRMAVRRTHYFTRRHANHAERAMLRGQPAIAHHPAQMASGQI